MSELEALELEIDALKMRIEAGEMLARLQKNRDFNKLINTAYLKEETLRLVSLLGTTQASKDPKFKEEVIKNLEVVAMFNAFLMNIETGALQAKDGLIKALAIKEELLNPSTEEDFVNEEVEVTYE